VKYEAFANGFQCKVTDSHLNKLPYDVSKAYCWL